MNREDYDRLQRMRSTDAEATRAANQPVQRVSVATAQPGDNPARGGGGVAGSSVHRFTGGTVVEVLTKPDTRNVEEIEAAIADIDALIRETEEALEANRAAQKEHRHRLAEATGAFNALRASLPHDRFEGWGRVILMQREGAAAILNPEEERLQSVETEGAELRAEQRRLQLRIGGQLRIQRTIETDALRRERRRLVSLAAAKAGTLRLPKPAVRSAGEQPEKPLRALDAEEKAIVAEGKATGRQVIVELGPRHHLLLRAAVDESTFPSPQEDAAGYIGRNPGARIVGLQAARSTEYRPSPQEEALTLATAARA
jgi:hypothetical protein